MECIANWVARCCRRRLVVCMLPKIEFKLIGHIVTFKPQAWPITLSWSIRWFEMIKQKFRWMRSTLRAPDISTQFHSPNCSTVSHLDTNDKAQWILDQPSSSSSWLSLDKNKEWPKRRVRKDEGCYYSICHRARGSFRIHSSRRIMTLILPGRRNKKTSALPRLLLHHNHI